MKMSECEYRNLLRKLDLYDEIAAEFKAKVRAFRAMKSSAQGDFLFKEFKHLEHDQWAFISHSFDHPENALMYRFNLFDRRGFICHNHMKLPDAIKELVDGNFHIPEFGTLDKIQNCQTWLVGLEVEKVRMRYNTGQISLTQMYAEMEKISVTVA